MLHIPHTTYQNAAKLGDAGRCTRWVLRRVVAQVYQLCTVPIDVYTRLKNYCICASLIVQDVSRQVIRADNYAGIHIISYDEAHSSMGVVEKPQQKGLVAIVNKLGRKLESVA